MSILRTENLSMVYQVGGVETKALDGVSVSIELGEFVAVMRPSGCGKSTLLHLMGGLDKPTAGNVWVNDQSIFEMSDDKLTELRRRQIGFVFQFFNLIPVLSAVENAALPLRLDGGKKSTAEQAAKTWLLRFDLGERLQNRPDQLSGGQQQKVALARALASEPDIVLADEPTGNLDTKSSEEVASLLRQVSKEWGHTVVMVTHDPCIAAYADRTIFLKDGKVVEDGHLAGESLSAVGDKLSHRER